MAAGDIESANPTVAAFEMSIQSGEAGCASSSASGGRVVGGRSEATDLRKTRHPAI